MTTYSRSSSASVCVSPCVLLHEAKTVGGKLLGAKQGERTLWPRKYPQNYMSKVKPNPFPLKRKATAVKRMKVETWHCTLPQGHLNNGATKFSMAYLGAPVLVGTENFCFKRRGRVFVHLALALSPKGSEQIQNKALRFLLRFFSRLLLVELVSSLFGKDQNKQAPIQG